MKLNNGISLDNLTAKEIIKELPRLSQEDKIYAIKKLEQKRDPNSIETLAEIVSIKKNNTKLRAVALLALGSFADYEDIINLKNEAVHNIEELVKNIIKSEKRNSIIYDAAKICAYEFEKRKRMHEVIY